VTGGRLHPNLAGRVAAGGVIAVLLCGGPVLAQDHGTASAAGPRAGSFEVAGTLLWSGGANLGSASATLTANQQGSPARVPLFTTETRRQSSFGYGIRAGFALSRVVACEAGLSRSGPALRVTVSGDAEGAPASTLSDARYAEYLVDASLVLHLAGLAIRGRAIPYVVVGGGQVRQLDEEAALVGTGWALHAGGGVKYYLRSRRSGLPRGFGVRADTRAYARSRRVDVAGKVRVTVAASVGGFVAF
jgi:hypothetical protein